MNEETKTRIKGLTLAIVIVCATAAGIILTQQRGTITIRVIRHDVKNFNSYEELTSFINYYNRNYRYPSGSIFKSRVTGYALDASSNGAVTESAQSVDYSGTNIQVPGVDEPDIVKTDGTYIYVVSQNNIFIVKAYPPEDAIIESVITLDSNLSIHNIFISDDRLVVFSEYMIYRVLPILYDVVDSKMILQRNNPETRVLIYDLTDIAKPELVKEVIVYSSYRDARLIGDYIYVITTQYYYTDNEDENHTYIPMIMVNNETFNIPLSDIYYADTPEKTNTLTYIISVNIKNDDEEVHCKIFLMGAADIIYVSHENIYIAYYNNYYYYYDYYKIQDLIYDKIKSLLPQSVLSQIDTVNSLDLEDYQKQEVTSWIIKKAIDTILTDQNKKQILESLIDQLEYTVIHRISINNGDIKYEVQGSVPGYVNNQFSFDEYKNHLRVSTTITGLSFTYYLGDIPPRTNLYVLDMDLNIIGSMEDITPGTGERIYATRFIGDLCYLVTFRQTDPFFVIDLSDPYNPTLMGELKIPGYSTYLHPYDEDHVIGVGMINNKVKISLFDVSDKENPLEVANYSIGENEWWSYSSALYDHKAFLFSKEKNLLVIPISAGFGTEAYVFDISVENGLKLKGNITHRGEVQTEYYHDYNYAIQRSLYIEDVLYTVSTGEIKMHSISDLTELNSVSLIKTE